MCFKRRREEERFDEIARIDCTQICALPGVLRNISNSGFNCYFPNPVTVDDETEYSVLMTFSHTDFSKELELICVPQWKIEKESETEIGFKILRSPDSPLLTTFVNSLKDKAKDDSDISELIISPDAEFVQ